MDIVQRKYISCRPHDGILGRFQCILMDFKGVNKFSASFKSKQNSFSLAANSGKLTLHV